MAAKKTSPKKNTTVKKMPVSQSARRPKTRTKIIQSQMTKKASASNGDPFQTGAGSSATQITVDFSSEQGYRGQSVMGLSSGPAATSIINSTVARRRSRHAVLTNSYAKRAIDVLVSNVVGAGHQMISMSTDPKFKKQLEDLWEDWTEQVDVAGKLNFASFEALAFRSMAEGGDCFIRLRTRRPEDRLAVPLQLQLFESEQVPVNKNEAFNNDRILAGIQFGPVGNIKFYHMHRNHPGDFTLSIDATRTIDTTPVPASEVIHLHDVRRPNEVRGLPILSQSLIQLSDLDRYMDAELVRKKAAALLGGFIIQPADQIDKNPFATVQGEAEDDDHHIEPLEPGSFPVLPEGYDVKFSDPADVGVNFKEFLRQQLLMISAAVNVTYEQLTGDSSQANERTIRSTMLEFKRMAMQYQNAILVHQFCRNVFNKWFDVALLSGALTIPAGMTEREARKVKWVADPWEFLNPLQEVNVDIKKVRAGFISRSEVIRASGRDPVEVENLIIAERQREADADLILDTNPATVSVSGVVQSLNPKAHLEDFEEPEPSEPPQQEKEDE